MIIHNLASNFILKMSFFPNKIANNLTFLLFIIILNNNNNKSETSMKLIKEVNYKYEGQTRSLRKTHLLS